MQVTTTTYVVKKETRLSLPKSDMIFYLASLIRVFLCPTRKYRVLSRKNRLVFHYLSLRASGSKVGRGPGAECESLVII